MRYSVRDLQRISRERSMAIGHDEPQHHWNPMEWCCAMAGEAGEACGVAKKMWRREHGLERPKHQWQDLQQQMADELADTLAYALLVADYLGIDLEDAFCRKFNEVSIQLKLPHRLP